MPTNNIANLRITNQHIDADTFVTPKDLVAHLGVVQAQDYNMSKWAIGIRLPNTSEVEVETAINRGDILRTHVLRPTWHLVSPDDIYWMLALSAQQVKASMKSRDKALGLDTDIYHKSYRVIEKALNGGKHLTRDELASELEQANLPSDSSCVYHIMLWAELDALICSGEVRDKDQTYALLEERVIKPKLLPSREESLAMLAMRYFSSHGPATLYDFAWWSGLSVTESRKALEMVKRNFVSMSIDKQTYWHKAISIPQSPSNQAFMLPAFDEFIISYKDRSATLPSNHWAKAVSSNGVFRPTIVVDGQTIGIWKRTVKKDQIILEPNFFEKPDSSTHALISQSFNTYARFLNKKAVYKL